MTDTRLSVGPYRVSFAEYRVLSAVASFGYAYRIYMTAISVAFTAFMQLGLWALVLFAHRLTIGPPPPAVVVGAIALAGIVAFAVCRATGVWAVRTYYRHQRISMRDYTVTIDNEGMRYELGDLKTSAPWTAIDRVIEKGGCFFFFLDQIAGVVVPRRAFPGSGEADAFFALAKERVEASNRGR